MRGGARSRIPNGRCGTLVVLLSLIAALLIEQAHPLHAGNRVQLWFLRYADFLERQCNAAQHHHGVIAWCLAMAPGVLVAIAVQVCLYRVNPLLSWLCNIGVLYLTMGFRQFSHSFTAIAEALRSGDLALAREILGRWRSENAAELTSVEIARVAIERGLLGAHRHVFGVMFWFALTSLGGIGAAGALAYRQAAMLSEKWGGRTDDEYGDFGDFAVHAFECMDWLPARLTAVSFAVVGDFEDAVYCWRAQAMSWIPASQGIILASGAGALGVRLGDALHQQGGISYRAELGVGDDADVDYMRSAVGLIWRALLLWLCLIFLMTLASWLGQ